MTAEMPAIDSDGYQCAKRGVTPRAMAGRTVGVHRKRLIFFQIRTILIVHSSLFECPPQEEENQKTKTENRKTRKHWVFRTRRQFGSVFGDLRGPLIVFSDLPDVQSCFREDAVQANKPS